MERGSDSLRGESFSIQSRSVTLRFMTIEMIRTPQTVVSWRGGVVVMPPVRRTVNVHRILLLVVGVANIVGALLVLAFDVPASVSFALFLVTVSMVSYGSVLTRNRGGKHALRRSNTR